MAAISQTTFSNAFSSMEDGFPDWMNILNILEYISVKLSSKYKTLNTRKWNVVCKMATTGVVYVCLCVWQPCVSIIIDS